MLFCAMISSMKIKVISWNIWGGKHLDDLISYLKNAEADVIALQESIKDEDGGNTALTIAQALGYECVSEHSVQMSSKWSGPEREKETTITFGNAILSKYKIINSSIHKLSEKRVAIQADVQIGKSILHVFGLHLMHQHIHGADEKRDLRQKEQTDNLLKIIPREKAIVMGDFNSVSGSYPVKKMEGVFKNSENGTISPTWSVYPEGCDICNPKLEAKFDYIFTTSDIITDSFVVGNSKASDHLPVIASIEI